MLAVAIFTFLILSTLLSFLSLISHSRNQDWDMVFLVSLIVAIMSFVCSLVVTVKTEVVELEVTKVAFEENGHFKAVILSDGFEHIFHKKAFIDSNDFTSYRKKNYNSFGGNVGTIHWFETYKIEGK